MKNKIKTIYIGIDVHSTNYNICFYDFETNSYKYESRLKANDCILVDYIKRMIKRHYSEGDYVFEIGYEAGYVGYQTYRYLGEHGLVCKVLAPNTIKRSAKQKRFKTDAADARLIAKTLANQDYSSIYVPTPEDESVKHLLSLRDLYKKELVQYKNKIKAHIQQKGYKPDKPISSNWTADYMKFLEECLKTETLSEDRFVLELLLEEYTHLLEKIEIIDKRIEEIAQEDRFKKDVDNLCAFKGISTLIAMHIILTVGDIRRFKTPKKFANYLRLTPGMHASAQKETVLGITKSGNKNLRRLLILAAQSYARGSVYSKSKTLQKQQEGLDPQVVAYAERARIRLQKKFIHLRNDRYKAYNTVVCAVARELANFIWGMLAGEID